MIAYLALEDGTILQGTAFGSEGRQFGEVVFNTSMTGYQKILTDPSYCGQIVVLTYPLVGNYGVNQDDYESARPWVRGFVIKELCDYPSNWRYWIKLEEFLSRHGIIGLAGIDTRALTRRLRNYGTMRGYIATGEQDPALLVRRPSRRPRSPARTWLRPVPPKRRRPGAMAPCRWWWWTSGSSRTSSVHWCSGAVPSTWCLRRRPPKRS